MEALGRLAAGVAHDFNNMLSVILSYCDLMGDDVPEEQTDLRESIDEVRKAGKRAAELTRQLLMFSRQEVVAPLVLDLNVIVESMSKMLQRVLGEDIEIVTVPGKGIGMVKIDPGHAEQILLNLVVNARDAMPTGGKLVVETANVVLDEALVLPRTSPSSRALTSACR